MREEEGEVGGGFHTWLRILTAISLPLVLTTTQAVVSIQSHFQ
jgi:hypothetical protein